MFLALKPVFATTAILLWAKLLRVAFIKFYFWGNVWFSRNNEHFCRGAFCAQVTKQQHTRAIICYRTIFQICGGLVLHLFYCHFSEMPLALVMQPSLICKSYLWCIKYVLCETEEQYGFNLFLYLNLFNKFFFFRMGIWTAHANTSVLGKLSV